MIRFYQKCIDPVTDFLAKHFLSVFCVIDFIIISFYCFLQKLGKG